MGVEDWEVGAVDKVLARIAEGAPAYSHQEIWDEIDQREAAGKLLD